MNYEDFIVRFEPSRDAGQPVAVIWSPAGQLRAPFGLELAELAKLRTDWERITRTLRRPRRNVEETATPQAVGERLYRALFSPPVERLFYRNLGRLEDDPERGLRLRLAADLEHPELARLAALPWELLYDPSQRQFLALSRRHPVVRFLEVPHPVHRPTVSGPLSLLLVISQPNHVEPLELEREWRQIEATWRRRGEVEVTCLEPPATPTRLRQELLAKSPQVVHFMGHGQFDPRSGEGALVLESPEGEPRLVTGPMLADLLRDLSLHLVFLNACDTAQATEHEELDPFTGVAAALVMSGLQAVVAMQHPISDEAAIVFSEHFYRRVAAGDAIDTAFSEARLALHTQYSESEWATPVLYLRATQGRLVEPPGRREKLHQDRKAEERSDSDSGLPWGKAALTLVAQGVVAWYLTFLGYLWFSSAGIDLDTDLMLFVALTVLALGSFVFAWKLERSLLVSQAVRWMIRGLAFLLGAGAMTALLTVFNAVSP